MSLVSGSFHTPTVVLVSDQCDDWHREHVGYPMKDSEQEGQSDDLLEYYDSASRQSTHTVCTI